MIMTSPPPLSFVAPAGSFKRRKRKSIVVTALLLVVSVLILVFGLAATTRTQNITVGGYYPGVIVSAGSPQGHSPSETVRYVCVWGVGEGACCSSPPWKNNRQRSLMGEFSPHSLFSIAVIRGWASLSVSAHKCVFFAHTQFFSDDTAALTIWVEPQIHPIWGWN